MTNVRHAKMVKSVGASILLFCLVADAQSTVIYFNTNNDGTTSRADLDGSNVQSVLVGGSGTRNTRRYLEIDATGDKLYFSVDAGSVNDSAINSVNTNGSDLTNLFGTIGARDLELDVSSGHIYAADSSTGIVRLNFDGSGQTTIVQDNAASFRGMGIDSLRDKLYWGDLVTDRIFRSDFDGTNVDVVVDLNSISPLVGNIYDIEVDAQNEKIYWSQGGSLDGIFRTDFDGMTIDVVTRGGTRGFDLDAANNKIYWGSLQGVSVANLDGGNKSLLIANRNDVFDVALGPPPSGNGTPVPEPTILALFGLGLAGLGWSRRRRA